MVIHVTGTQTKRVIDELDDGELYTMHAFRMWVVEGSPSSSSSILLLACVPVIWIITLYPSAALRLPNCKFGYFVQ